MKRLISILALLFAIPCTQAMEPEYPLLEGQELEEALQKIAEEEYLEDTNHAAKKQRPEPKMLAPETIQHIAWLKSGACFAELPAEIKQKIAEYLVGAPPFWLGLGLMALERVTKNIRNLRNTCIQMQNLVDKMTEYFITELANRYTYNKLEAALALRTSAAGKWLQKNYLENKQKIIDSFAQAIKQENIKVMDFLLHFCPQLISTTTNIKLPYHPEKSYPQLTTAIVYKKIKAVRFLIAAGANVHNSTFDVSALQMAVGNASIDMVTLLLETPGKKRNKQINDALIHAVDIYGYCESDLERKNALFIIIEKLLEAGADVNAQYHNQTALMLAARWGDPCLLEKLLACKDINIDFQITIGDTALSKAIRYYKIDSVERLLQAGANPNLTDKFGRNALDIAKSLPNKPECLEVKEKIIEALKRYGAKKSQDLIKERES